jgi:septal ring factor EnvC (AmiA/AmiB activator)
MATLNSATDSVDAAMEEIRVLRCDLQRMTTAREDADAIIQGKERELQMVTMHLRRVEELLRRSEDCQKKLENKIRQALAILDNANTPPAVLAIRLSIVVCSRGLSSLISNFTQCVIM